MSFAEHVQSHRSFQDLSPDLTENSASEKNQQNPAPSSTAVPRPVSPPGGTSSGLNKSVSVSDNPKVEKAVSPVLKPQGNRLKKVLMIGLGLLSMAVGVAAAFLAVYLLFHIAVLGAALVALTITLGVVSLLIGIFLELAGLALIGLSKHGEEYKFENDFAQIPN